MTFSTACRRNTLPVTALALAYWRLHSVNSAPKWPGSALSRPEIDSFLGELEMARILGALPDAHQDPPDDPYQTCEYGHHTYRWMGEHFHCADCGSTDPEGDSAR